MDRKNLLKMLSVFAVMAVGYFAGLLPAWAMGVPIVFGTTYTTFTANHGAIRPHLGETKMFWVEKECDFTGLTLVANDLYPALQVKAGWKVIKTNVRVVTAAVGTALNFDIGDGSGADSYDANIDAKGAAGTEYESTIGTDAYVAGGNGKLYTADDTIDIKLKTVTDVTTNGKYKVRALIQAIN